MQQQDRMMRALLSVLIESRDVWQLECRIRSQDNSNTIDVTTGTAQLSITRAPADMPFRWVVTINGRRRTAASVNGVLRTFRQTLAPGYEPQSLRIAAPFGPPP